MRMIKRTFYILAVASFVLPINAYADSWSCSKNNDVREIHIERTTSEPVPCNVVYKKQTEGVEDQVLWNAENDDSFCEEKAKGFISKLESWGWVCTETVREESVTEDTAVDSNSMDAEQ